MAEKLNIVVFMPDQLRAESVGCYGHPLVRTPNIDRLASEGVRFENCLAQYPLCSPSRCSLLTGWYPHTAGHRNVYHLLQPHEPNLFKYLKSGGYDVYWYGSNDVLVHNRFGESATEWGFFADGPEWSGKDNPWPRDDPRFFSFLYNPGRERSEIPDYRRVEAAIRVLEKRRSSRPFCIFLPLFFPHPPFTAPRDFYDMYDPENLPPLRPPGTNKPRFYELIRTGRRLDRLDESVLRKINAVYLGMISYSDWLLGRLLDAVDSSGHRDDTAVIFCSDHGEWAGDYGLVEKWSAAADDALLRVPLILRTPGGANGHVVREMVELFDLFATVMELAGIEPRHTHFATSLVTQAAGKPGDPARVAFAEGGYNATEPHAFARAEDFPEDHVYFPKIRLEAERPDTVTRITVIRTPELKLAFRPGGQSELYDLARDPLELDNRFEAGEYAPQRQALLSSMLAWYVRTSGVIPMGLADERPLPAAPRAPRP